MDRATPCPTWDELLEAITKKFKGGLPSNVGDGLSKIVAGICNAHRDNPNFMFVDTNHVLAYLEKEKSSVPQQLTNLLFETIAQMDVRGIVEVKIQICFNLFRMGT